MVLTEQEKKERKRIYNKEYGKKYREKNREKRKEDKRIYYQKNKERIIEKNKEYGKKWRNENKEYNTKRIKEYHINNPHVKIIANWKRYGLISDDYRALYDEFINATHCQVCDKLFGKESRNIRCMDHDHETGEFRCFACGDCNLHNRMIK